MEYLSKDKENQFLLKKSSTANEYDIWIIRQRTIIITDKLQLNAQCTTQRRHWAQ